MSLPTLTNYQIDQGNESDKTFGGTFSRNNLPYHLAAKYYIVNLDSTHGGGTHWCLLDNRRPTICFYLDPFGYPPPEEVGAAMLKTGKELQYNDVDVQELGSEACGWWCEYFAEEFAKGHDFRSAIAFATKQPNPDQYLASIYEAPEKEGEPFRFHKRNFLQGQMEVGGGIFKFIKDRIHFKPRQHATKRFKDFLAKEGDKPIVKVEVGRKPLAGAVNKALNILSLGGLNKVKKKLGYDDIYHNYMVVTLANGRKYKIEKNHVVEAKGYNEMKDKDKLYNVPLKNYVSLQSFMTRAEGKDKKFWEYDPSSRNCQKFVADMVHNNELTPDPESEVASVIKEQNAPEIINSLPGPLQAIPKATTDLAGVLDRVVHGDGLKKKRGRKETQSNASKRQRKQ